MANTELNGGPKADPWDGLWQFTERARGVHHATPRTVIIARQDKGSELGRRSTDQDHFFLDHEVEIKGNCMICCVGWTRAFIPPMHHEESETLFQSLG